MGGFAGVKTAQLANTSGSIDADLAGVVALNVGDGRAEINSTSALKSSNGTGLVGLAAIKVGDASGATSDVFIDNTGIIDDFGVSIAGVAVGDGNKTQISTMKACSPAALRRSLALLWGIQIPLVLTIIRTDGVGIAGVAVGDGNGVTIQNKGFVDAGLVGIAGVVVGDNNSVNVNNSGAITTDGAGVVGVAVGTGNAVDVVSESSITGGLLGVAGVNIGDANGKITNVTNQAKITNDGIGVAGVVTGNGHQLNVDNQAALDTAVGGVLAVALRRFQQSG